MNSKIQSVVLLYAALSVGHATIVTTEGCGGPVLTPQETANLSYKAQLAACVDQYATRPAIDACRRRVEKAWASDDAGAPEAGHTLNFGNDNDGGAK